MAEGRRPDGQPTCGVWPKASLCELYPSQGGWCPRCRIDGGVGQSFTSLLVVLKFLHTFEEGGGVGSLTFYTAPTCPTVTVWDSTIYCNSWSPSSLAWVQRTQAGLRPKPHAGWPSGLRPLLKLNPTVFSLACRWRLRSVLRANQESFFY